MLADVAGKALRRRKKEEEGGRRNTEDDGRWGEGGRREKRWKNRHLEDEREYGDTAC
jgi:hypothetical protein